MADTYKTIQGDTWDIIAKQAYGAERHLDYLMACNFELLEYFIFPAGVVVNTPALPRTRTEILPEWRR